MRKGIILSGGSGTRLNPVTMTISKQLLPVYDKPMIYYPLAVLMEMKIRDILIITTPRDIDSYRNLLGDGKRWGINFSFCVQQKPSGIAESMIIAQDFLDNAPSVLILGDNIFYGNNLNQNLLKSSLNLNQATIFAYRVNDPERYGVADFDKNNNVISIVEKPKNPKSNYAITGLYFYPPNAPEYAKKLKPSKRQELEITDLNKMYLNEKNLKIDILGEGCAWLDTGTHDSLLDASLFVSTIEKRQGIKICCPEEIAFKNKWITNKDLEKLIIELNNSSYSDFLKKVINEK